MDFLQGQVVIGLERVALHQKSVGLDWILKRIPLL